MKASPGTLFALTVILGLTACEGGLAPESDDSVGTIRGTVTYLGQWPPEDSVRDLRFVALRFVPADTSDFLQLNRIEVSRQLEYGLASDTFSVRGVGTGVFPYSGIARQVTENLFSWAPLGLVSENDGVIILGAGETIDVNVTVDFAHIPRFP
ncbi:MAG: hypothetical protein KDD65_18050 [Bacteroidetes bacterium]|nr:hypothetical protein [Bacteroidota bacterium]